MNLTCPRCGEAHPTGVPAWPLQPRKCPVCDGRFFVRVSYLWVAVAALVGLGGLVAAKHFGWPEAASGPFAILLLVALLFNVTVMMASIIWTSFREAVPFACQACGKRMRRLEVARGALAMSPEELASGQGPAEQCMECGKAYCASCYPNRPNVCACGQHALRLVKVQYES